MKLVQEELYISREEQAVNAYRNLFPQEIACHECHSKSIVENVSDTKLASWNVAYDYYERQLTCKCLVCGYTNVITRDKETMWGYYLIEHPIRLWMGDHIGRVVCIFAIFLFFCVCLSFLFS